MLGSDWLRHFPLANTRLVARRMLALIERILQKSGNWRFGEAVAKSPIRLQTEVALSASPCCNSRLWSAVFISDSSCHTVSQDFFEIVIVLANATKVNFGLSCSVNPSIQFTVPFSPPLVPVSHLCWPGSPRNLIRSWLLNEALCFSLDRCQHGLRVGVSPR